jgi:hypothetical protein
MARMEMEVARTRMSAVMRTCTDGNGIKAASALHCSMQAIQMKELATATRKIRHDAPENDLAERCHNVKVDRSRREALE